jgi:putative transposase
MYLTTLAGAASQAMCDLHAYVLMTNHVHLLVTPRASNSAALLMIDIGRRYVRYFNDVHDRSGPLWEGRFRSSPVDTDAYFLACSRYIELNPVRAGMVRHPGAYLWSSFRENAIARRRESWLSPHPCYLELGHDEQARMRAYASLFDHDLPVVTLSRIRQATRGGISTRGQAPSILD